MNSITRKISKKAIILILIAVMLIVPIVLSMVTSYNGSGFTWVLAASGSGSGSGSGTSQPCPHTQESCWKTKDEYCDWNGARYQLENWCNFDTLHWGAETQRCKKEVKELICKK